MRLRGWTRGWTDAPTAAVLVPTMLVVPALALLVARSVVRHVPSFPDFFAFARSVASIAPDVRKEEAPWVEGHVVDADGDAVPGAIVAIVSAAPPYTVYQVTRTDRAARFSFPRFSFQPPLREPDPAALRVVAGHDPEGVATEATGSERSEARGAHRSDGLLIVLTPSAIRGSIVDADDRPIAGAAVFVEGAPWFDRRTVSDEQGAFVLAAVPHEAGFLVASARGYDPVRVDVGRPSGEPEKRVRIRLPAAPQVEGEVRDVAGSPIRAEVVACEGQDSETQTTSGDDGAFRLPPSAIGCDVVARRDDYAPSEAAPAVQRKRVVLRLRTGGAIEGVVLDEHGRALPSFGVGIEVFSTETHGHKRRFGSRASRTFDDPRGTFRIDKLTPGRYVLTATAGGKTPTRSDSVDVTAATTTTGVRLVMFDGGSVVGHVYDEHQRPLGGVDLSFDATSGAGESGANATTTDGGGRYRIDAAPTGPFTLRVHKDGYRTRLVSGLWVAPAATLMEDVSLSDMEGGSGLELVGIGATLAPTTEGVKVLGVFAGDPAERAGVRAGDRIVGVDGEATDEMSVSDVIQRLRGPEKTLVGVTIERTAGGERFDVLIPRAAIRH